MCVMVLINPVSPELCLWDIQIALYAVQVASSTAQPVIAYVTGRHQRIIEEQLKNLGINTVCLNTDPLIDIFETKVCAEAMLECAEGATISVVITDNSAPATCVAAFLAISLKAAFIPNVISSPYFEKGFMVEQAIVSGETTAYVKSGAACHVLTIHKALPFDEQKMADFGVAASNERDFAASVETNITAESYNPSLDKAGTVICGGVGVRTGENWSFLEDLCEMLQGKIGCTKPVSDKGVRPKGDCIGQDGTTIHPSLYLTFGVSGAAYHLNGVKKARNIFAVDKDPGAPIFQVADFGIVGDLDEILPILITEIRRWI